MWFHFYVYLTLPVRPQYKTICTYIECDGNGFRDLSVGGLPDRARNSGLATLWCWSVPKYTQLGMAMLSASTIRLGWFPGCSKKGVPNQVYPSTNSIGLKLQKLGWESLQIWFRPTQQTFIIYLFGERPSLSDSTWVHKIYVYFFLNLTESSFQNQVQNYYNRNIKTVIIYHILYITPC